MSKSITRMIAVLAVAGMLFTGSAAQAALLADFNSSSGVSGTSVDTWTSTGSLAPTATAAGSKKPTLVANVFSGGQPGLLFDGSDDRMVFSDAGFPSGTNPEWTMVAAFRLSSGQSNFSAPLGWGSDNATNNHNQVGMGRWNNTDPTLRHDDNGGGAASSLALAENVNYVGIISHASGSNDIVFTVIENGVATHETVTYYGGSPDSNVILEGGRIGNIVDAGGELGFFPMMGHIGRIHVYDNAIGLGAPRDALVNQLKSYTIPEPSSAALLAMGLAGLFGFAGRRRNR